jgi:two-component system response regulator LytT
VRWVEAQRGYTRLHTAAGSCLVSVPMGAFLAAQAGGGFVRIHRSYAVQVAAVSELRRVGGGYAVVVDGQVLPVSRRAAVAVAGRLRGGAKPAMPAEGAMAAERVERVERAVAVGPGRAVA